MKRYLKYTAAAVSAVTMAASAVPAMAAQVIVNDGKQNTAEAAEETKETAETTAQEAVETAETTPAEESIGYSTLAGKITAVTFEEDGTARITFQNEERGEIIFIEGADCMVIADNELKTLQDLKEGMEVTIVMNDMAPMTMSIPPQTSGAVAIVANGETPVFTAVEKFDDELTGQTLKLNIDETVQILDIRGTKQVLTADSIKGHKAMVVYGASTKSIPAQTTPAFVVILDNGEEATETTDTTAPETKTTDTTETTETPEEIKNLPLRTTLEEMGYTIEWTSNDEPIVITKDGLKATVAIDSTSVAITGAESDTTYELSSAVILVDGVTYIPSDVMTVLK